MRLGAKNGTWVEPPWDARCVDIDIDIATFMISPREFEARTAPYVVESHSRCVTPENRRCGIWPYS
ncbi:hypothetical protein [Bradyrhizobium sp. RDM4]|uniref:hypothetical protein n=1 Tax=Bradyrhizobium sp. RDM4 TaxID=3378765 RepID=UPI0038FD2595